MKCKKCLSEIKLEEHHIIPKCIWDNINYINPDGSLNKKLYTKVGKQNQTVVLCKKCHDIIHKILLSTIWPYVSDQQGAKFAIKSFTKWWVNKE